MSDIPPPTTPVVLKDHSSSHLLTDPVWNAVPVPMTPLLGRDKEIDHICALLIAPATRLLTLTGPGGVGKTRLAIEAATQIAPEFAHGACFVALAPVREPTLVPRTVAEALGLQNSGDTTPQDTLMSVLRDRHLLLVLDNMEHVLTSVDSWLPDLFAECPHLHVLITSRVSVQIDGEQRFIVQPLPVPTDETGEGVTDNAAVKLFAQRARSANPGFFLTTAHSGVVAEICCRLEGLPLAIELAASQVAVLSPPVILTRLTDPLSILGCNRRDTPDRHRTMRDAIAWSYDLLPPGAQGLFRRLAVSAGGFTLDAAEAIGDPMPLGLLTMLVDHSLVRRLSSPSQGSRMAMYETIREFGLEQLVIRGEVVAARDAHADYFLRLGAEVKAQTRNHGQLEWCAPFEVEQDNLRAAIVWLVQQERFEEARKLATDTMWCHWLPRLDTENREILEIVLAQLLAALHSGGRAKGSRGIQGSEKMEEDPNRAKLTDVEAFSIFADLITVACSAIGNSDVSAAFIALQSLKPDDDPHLAIEYEPSHALADAPGPPKEADASIGLTLRELDVLRLMADGLTNQEIADALFLSLRTVTSHVTRVLNKLAVPSRTAAVSTAIRHGLI